ncbi:2-succinyl-5-enolpyruvyl-6-hydroxy-3-cyclohexene-1-carboxylic-acid synthase [Dermacoccus nishinomiyaensis]|uniref:2-succinyl-5-enolpyruvyl-6-hydroxy-3- cyclohexene-1-carboxylic-acid synthase n=1 Tax=Dermacoccus nishinomiyaensis TaxID=1274 RepID=UPI0021A72DCA|nr:2-succinyl-5-enolpyruvyl-6-hydroxy-3-cyclohexene-1-carboxylic-acid synthase [Dermacoccus nishinomiyaensis]MCT1604588.1 2-succinyl-5-enolpyruvyl-6-hydroxy-3-cyclohexene-1-carboxylic-acid synthase [Dermacoccus nishinomiyaensis]
MASVIIDELVRLGVKDVVLSPGSRSAPLAYAVAAADKAGRLRLHVRVDERSAGFLALGLAKISRNPVPVITTSGTAVANLHPAVLEAHHAQVPLIIMSADRPAELRDTGANQTTDQVKIFGSATRWFHEFATPSERAGQNTVWRSVVGRAFAHATGVPTGDVGPVHLNLPFREPLTPDVADLAMAGAVAGAAAIVARDTSATSDEDGRADDAPSTTSPVWPESLEGRDRGRPWMQLRAPASTVTVAPGPGIAPVPRTLVLLGDLPDPKLAAEVAELADAAGWPVIAEPFGDYHRGRAMPHGSLILAAHDWLDEHLPERVLVAGRMTLSRDVAKLLRHPEVTVEVITASTSWADPSHVVQRVHEWAAIARSHELVAACADRRWSSSWRIAGQRLAQRIGPLVARSWPSGLAATSTLVQHVPAGSALLIGSSNTARDLDLGRNPQRIARRVCSVANRGLSGIDGVVSTAVGIALSHDGPSFALMGDLTFLHDSNGLLIGPGEPRPDLTIVVINDDGGGIFGMLEQGRSELAEHFERVFGTPTNADLALVCEARGVGYSLVGSRDELIERVSDPAPGLNVIEVRIERHLERQARHDLFAAAIDAVADAGEMDARYERR